MATFPEIPQEMVQESDEWAFEKRIEGLSEELDGYMLDTYYKGFAIYQRHLRGIAYRVETAGGIAEVRYKTNPMFEKVNNPYRNEMILNDGTAIGLGEVVAIPKFREKLPVPPGLPETATRTHEIQLSFGGKYVSHNAEDVFDIEQYWFHDSRNRPFEVLMNDPTYFPEDMGITERVVIDLHEPFYPENFSEELHVVKQSFSLDGKIWRPHLVFDDSEDIPNPYTDPLGYRRWALAGDAKLELGFQAPTTIRERSNFTHETIVYKAMKTVIEHLGRIRVEGSESTPRDVLGQFQHYMELMDFCYTEYIPIEERQVVNQEIEQQQRSRYAALPVAESPSK